MDYRVEISNPKPSPLLPPISSAFAHPTGSPTSTLLPPLDLISLTGNQEEEIEIVRSSLTKSSPLLILTMSKKQSLALESSLIKYGYRVEIYKDMRSFISLDMLDYWLSRKSWKRKESVLIVKLTHWISETESGLIDELKYYGDERALIDLFRAEPNEANIFVDRQRASLEDTTILIADLSGTERGTKPLLTSPHSLIIRDIISIEDIVRRVKSRHISFEKLLTLSESLSHMGEPTLWEDLITGISIIADIYRSVPERPKGNTPFPPGDFGETYLMTQRDLWQRGYTWLILATKKLEDALARMMSLTMNDPIEKRSRVKLILEIQLLISFSREEQKNTSILIHITPLETKISYIPRDVREGVRHLIKTQSGISNTLV